MIAFITLPYSLLAQVNYWKKYAGSYHILAFGVDAPTTTSTKIILSAEGKWSSTAFPVDENGIPAKVAVKKTGTWKASEGVIQIHSLNNGLEEVTEYKLDAGLFIGTDTYLDPIFITEPTYLKIYAGAYHLLEEDQEQPALYTRTIKLAADGTCMLITPTIDDNGVASSPTSEKSIWKARQTSLQVFLKEDEQDKPTGFEWCDKFFRSRNGYYLKKVPPPPPPNPYLKLYAGTYYMVLDGHPINAETDKYVFLPDGKATWTIYVRSNPDGTITKEPFTRNGTWLPSAGRIQMYFPIEEYDMGDIPASNFTLVNGVFRHEQVYLKKVETTKAVK